MKVATFRWRCCYLAKCGVRLRWRRRSTAKLTKAGNCARKWRQNEKPCASLKSCRKGDRQSAIGGTSFSFEVEGRCSDFIFVPTPLMVGTGIVHHTSPPPHPLLRSGPAVRLRGANPHAYP